MVVTISAKRIPSAEERLNISRRSGSNPISARNFLARSTRRRAREFLAEIGIEPERLEMFNLSSAVGPRFAEIVTLMTERLRKLGPSPLRRPRAAVQQNIQDMTQQAETALAGASHDCCRS
jgi:hypothetical protein